MPELESHATRRTKVAKAVYMANHYHITFRWIHHVDLLDFLRWIYVVLAFRGYYHVSISSGVALLYDGPLV